MRPASECPLWYNGSIFSSALEHIDANEKRVLFSRNASQPTPEAGK